MDFFILIKRILFVLIDQIFIYLFLLFNYCCADLIVYTLYRSLTVIWCVVPTTLF